MWSTLRPSADVSAIAEPAEAEQQRLRFASASTFAREAARRVHEEFAASGDHRFADAGQWLQALTLLITGISAYAMILFGGLSDGAIAACATFASVCNFMLLVVLGHGATHGAISPRRWVNDLVVFVTFAGLGVSGALWRDRHVRLHHNYANLAGIGIDADSSFLLRLSPHKTRRAWHALQPVYGPLLYAAGLLHMVWIEDFQRFARARRARAAEFSSWRALAAFVGAKAIHVTLFLAIPAAVLAPSVGALLGTYALAMGASSLVFVVLAVGTHISDLAEFPMPDGEGRLPYDWATHQVLTSVDWMPTNKFVIGLAGGANAEAAHHLFPGFSHRHAAMLSRIVFEVASAHGLAYHAVSFSGMLLAHWRQLVRLSRSTAASETHFQDHCLALRAPNA